MQPIIDISNTTLTTDRLILRPFCENDLEDFYTYASVPGVGEMAGWRHHETRETSRAILKGFLEEKEVLAVVHKESGKVIGSLGIHAGNDEINTPTVREIGYVLSRDYWGQGLMPEAVQEVIRHCFEDLKLDALTVGHFTENSQSRRVIEKCGFRFLKHKQYHAKHLDGRMIDECFYVLYREDWYERIHPQARHIEKAKIGIICAGDHEVAPFLPMIKNGKTSKKAMLHFCEGTIEGVDTVTLFSGVCKVNAAIATQILIDTYGCNMIINAGTAGGIDDNVCVLDTVVTTETAYHDVSQKNLTDFHPWMQSAYFKSDDTLLALAQKAAADHRVFFGRTVTGEQFITDEARDAIRDRFAPLSVDMETAAVAHVCYANNIPFIAVRTISDTPNRDPAEDFVNNFEKAAQISADFVRRMLKAIPK